MLEHASLSFRTAARDLTLIRLADADTEDRDESAQHGGEPLCPSPVIGGLNDVAADQGAKACANELRSRLKRIVGVGCFCRPDICECAFK